MPRRARLLRRAAAWIRGTQDHNHAGVNDDRRRHSEREGALFELVAGFRRLEGVKGPQRGGEIMEALHRVEQRLAAGRGVTPERVRLEDVQGLVDLVLGEDFDEFVQLRAGRRVMTLPPRPITSLFRAPDCPRSRIPSPFAPW